MIGARRLSKQKCRWIQTLCILILIQSMAFGIKPPLLFTAQTVGIEYTGMWKGQQIDSDLFSAQELLSFATAHFAPLPFMHLNVGAGINSFAAVSKNQDGPEYAPSFAPAAGLTFYTPSFAADHLSMNAGVQFYYLVRAETDKGTFNGAFTAPFVGMTLQPLEFLNFSFGARGNVISGTRKKTDGSKNLFHNAEYLKGFAELGLFSQKKGVWCILGMDASPEVSFNSRIGPDEASLYFSVGFTMMPFEKKDFYEKTFDQFFPMRKKLEEKLDRLEKELED